jgi:hypothetical protein
MVFRTVQMRKKQKDLTADLNPKHGFWYGPGVVLALESSDPDKLRPRLYYVSLLGRLYRCAEHQLRALSPQATLARLRLEEASKRGELLVGSQGVNALKPEQPVKGIDITKEA